MFHVVPVTHSRDPCTPEAVSPYASECGLLKSSTLVHLRSLGEDLFLHVKIALSSKDNINLTIDVEDNLLQQSCLTKNMGIRH